MTINFDELLDIVDRSDIVIGQKRRSEVYAAGMVNFRVVNAFLINTSGQLWLTRRSAQKRIFPMGLDMSVGGHVESGESYQSAFRRELYEELNLDLDGCCWRTLGYLTPYEDHVSAFMTVYEIQTEAFPHYNRDDFIEAFWLMPEEAISRIEQGESAKNDLPVLIRHFYT
jgi:isopentenyl-diphosphate delta-isomerase